MVTEAWLRGIAVSSNYARTHAQELACAASCGLITTLQAPGEAGRMWRPTPKGMDCIVDGMLEGLP